MNLTPFKAKLLGIEHLLPTIKHIFGPYPGMTSKNLLGAMGILEMDSLSDIFMQSTFDRV